MGKIKNESKNENENESKNIIKESSSKNITNEIKIFDNRVCIKPSEEFNPIKKSEIKEEDNTIKNLELTSDEITKIEFDFSTLLSVKKEDSLFILNNSQKVKEIICKICYDLIDNNTVHENNHLWIGDLIKKEMYKENIKNFEDWLYGKKFSTSDSKEDYKKRNTNYYKENNINLAFKDAQKDIINKYNGKYKLLDLSNVDLSFHIKILIGGRKLYFKDENTTLWHNHNTDNYF
jgi:hypothetical protein